MFVLSFYFILMFLSSN